MRLHLIFKMNHIPAFSILLLATLAGFVHAGTSPKFDKSPWKPIISNSTVAPAKNSTKTNRRQFSSHNGASRPQQQMIFGRVPSLIPPSVTFNAPQVVYGNGAPNTRQTPPTTPSVQFRNANPSFSNFGDVKVSGPSNGLPSYAAPVSPQQYQLVPQQPLTVPTTPAPPTQTYTFQLVAPPSTTPAPPPPPPQDNMQYQLVMQPQSASKSRSYAPSQQGIQLQVIHPSPMETSPNFVTTPAPTATHHQTSSKDNATFVDVVSVLSNYFRATGTQLTEMFQQLSDNSELNGWGRYPWSTPTTTTTPAPTPTPHPPHNPPVVVMPIVMPAPAAPAPVTYTSPPSTPPPQTYSPPPAPLASSSQPQASYSHIQPSYSPPPPSFTMQQPTFSQQTPMMSPPMYQMVPQSQVLYSQHPPVLSHPSPIYIQDQQGYVPPPHMMPQHSTMMSQPPPQFVSMPTMLDNPTPQGFPEGKSANFDILDNSIDHDYYYDCDK